MGRLWLVWIAGALWLATSLAGAQNPLPTPESHFGHPMGADRKLVDWDGVVSYYKQARRRQRRTSRSRRSASPPKAVRSCWPPSLGRETLARLGFYQELQARLFDPRRTTPTRRRDADRAGKTVVLLTCSIHSSEPASTMTAMEFVHSLLTKDTPRTARFSTRRFSVLIPSLNPDGVDKVAKWYRRFVGTEYEGAPMTELYHKYVGHDNNRDWYMFTQQETRLTVEKVHNVWRPQIVYDVHQMGSTGARIFVPPWDDPVDPNIDPAHRAAGQRDGDRDGRGPDGRRDARASS
jgi:hypothetical protein